MNNYQQNRLKMYNAITECLDKNDKITLTLPEFKAFYPEFRARVTEIESLSFEQMKYSKTEAPEKKQRKKALLKMMEETSVKLTLFAKLTNNYGMLPNVKYTHWALSRIHQIELPIKAKTLYDTGEAYRGKLESFGITVESQEKLKKAIEDYEEKISEPRMYRIRSKMATTRIAEAFREADDILYYIDLIGGIAATTFPGFYSSYKISRKQPKSGKVKMALKAQASDNWGKPVSNAVFTFNLIKPARRTSPANKTIIKKTRGLGGFYILHIPPGTYEITVTKAGYKEIKLNQYIDDKNLLSLKVEMEQQ
jgi:hypothetical protein